MVVRTAGWWGRYADPTTPQSPHDVRKAFDTVDFSAFTHSLKTLGFTDEVIKLISNLQSDFEVSVRTPVGMTGSFTVGRGCKQGCSLSPLRFVLVLYDIFLKYLEQSEKGYKWKLQNHRVNGRDTLCIPGCALADDMLLMSDDPQEFSGMVEDFSEFLTAVGMSLNPTKCHYTTVNVEHPVRIEIPDHEGWMHEVDHRSNEEPIKYLGYRVLVKDCGTGITEQWKVHNEMLLAKLQKACSKIVKSSCKKPEVPHLINSDIVSVLPYFMYVNYMPAAARKAPAQRVEGEEDEEEGQGGEAVLAKPVHLLQLKSEISRALQNKLKSQLNMPHYSIFNRSTGMGMGIRHPAALYDTVKVINIVDCLNSPNEYCSITTRETIYSIRRRTGLDVTRPKWRPTVRNMHHFPLHYMEAAKALHKIQGRIIMRNPHHTGSGDISVECFVAKGISKEGRKSIFGKGKDFGKVFMSEALGDLCEGPQEGWRESTLGKWLTGEVAGTHRHMKGCFLEKCREWLGETDAKALANAL